MRKKRGSSLLIELGIAAALLLIGLAIVGITRYATSITSMLAPATPTRTPLMIAGRLPTPAPTITPRPRATPTAIAAAASDLVAGHATMTSHLRHAPRVANETQQAILCPNDSIAFVAQTTIEGIVWYHIRVTGLAEECAANHAIVGTEGWASSKVLSTPPADVPLADS